jgi:hypothetical protein
LKSKTKYFSKGSIIADSREPAKGLMVISSGFINAELPMDSDEADEENRDPNGKTLLYVFGRGYVSLLQTCIKIRVASVSCKQSSFIHNAELGIQKLGSILVSSSFLLQ